MTEGTAVVIGSGLGGLECAYILAKHGMRVIVLEKEVQAGGALQTFRRRDSLGLMHTFDTGFHYAGGLDEGQPLHTLFRYFGLDRLPWTRLDLECADEVVFAGQDGVMRYPMASGYFRFAERLSEFFPSQKDALHRYAAFLKEVNDNIFRAFSPDAGMNSLFSVPAYEYLSETFSDPLLIKVLSGSSLNMELSRKSLPLYVFAQIHSSFISSSWRLGQPGSENGPEGGAMIVSSLAESVRRMGGEILTRTEALRILTDGMDKVTGVEARRPGGETVVIPADIVISDAHPSLTISLVDDCRAMRRIYRSRMTALCNTGGMFTANIALKPGAMPYLNRNVFVHRDNADLWEPAGKDGRSIMIHFACPAPGGSATSVDILSPVSACIRDEGYGERKASMASECISLASNALPGLEEAVSDVWTSTPSTWESYTGTPGGSAYGAAKDCRNPMATVLSPRTPLRNLFMTGQSLNLHGLLGVSMTSAMACGAVIGMETIANEILTGIK
ncbi:MAG: phytoene desaturase family protein [Candidatus Cryptobacteroides sp.]